MHILQVSEETTETHRFSPFPHYCLWCTFKLCKINILGSNESTYLGESEGAIEHFLFTIFHFGSLNVITEDRCVQSHMDLIWERAWSSKVYSDAGFFHLSLDLMIYK